MTNHIVCFDPRPDFVPDGWVIWNAPRPMYGSELPSKNMAREWRGDFLTGIWYAAVNPEDPYAADWTTHNEWDNGAIVEYATITQARVEVSTHYVLLHGARMGNDRVMARVDAMSDHQIMSQYARLQATGSSY